MCEAMLSPLGHAKFAAAAALDEMGLPALTEAQLSHLALAVMYSGFPRRVVTSDGYEPGWLAAEADRIAKRRGFS
jgi:hypothetical protein